MCSSENFSCINCKGLHHPFDLSCSIFHKFKLINTIMAYCNINQYKAKRLIKIRNISNIEQAEQIFKSSTFSHGTARIWILEMNLTRGLSTPSLYQNKQNYQNKFWRNKTSSKYRSTTVEKIDDQTIEHDMEDQTIVFRSEEDARRIEQSPSLTLVSQNQPIFGDREISSVSTFSENKMEVLFSGPGLIFKTISIIQWQIKLEWEELSYYCLHSFNFPEYQVN